MTKQTLVFLVGPPAVGKMTVGRALSQLTGLPLFHNHLSIEAVWPVFSFGTKPFGRLVTGLRENMMREVANSDLPGVIFTYVWAFDQPGELKYVQRLMSIFEEGGGRSVFVELTADLDTRLERNEGADRLAAKPSKRNVEASRQHMRDVDEKFRLTSDGGFPFAEHLLIDNTAVSPSEVAGRIATHFDLPVVPQ